MEYFKYFKVEGVASKTEYDAGLTSSQEAPKRLKSIMINVAAREGNKIQGWLEREKVFELPDHLIDTQELAGSDQHPLSMNALNEIPVGSDMPVGTTFKVAIESATTESDIYGAYRYEIIK
ncbi:unnamed protein product [marine sediment metagenome]|uniref:Uncharacterized protein n=1 Tax=marine sediment metagenome TaxID=412755 RepID=X1V5F6_9ZZZZ